LHNKWRQDLDVYRVRAIIVTSCHGNDDEAWSTSCLIMQHKPYIVELSFMETQKNHMPRSMKDHH